MRVLWSEALSNICAIAAFLKMYDLFAYSQIRFFKYAILTGMLLGERWAPAAVVLAFITVLLKTA